MGKWLFRDNAFIGNMSWRVRTSLFAIVQGRVPEHNYMNMNREAYFTLMSGTHVNLIFTSSIVQLSTSALGRLRIKQPSDSQLNE